MTVNRLRGIPRRRKADAPHAGNGSAPSPLDAVGDGPRPPAPAAEQVFFGAAEGKDPRTGRFQKGNKLGRGNPFARRQAEMHQAFLAAVTPESVQSLAVSLWVRAKKGDMAAAALVLSYLIGKPRTAPDPDRLDLAEFKLAAGAPTLPEVACATDGIDPAAATALIRYLLDAGVDPARAQDRPAKELTAILALMQRVLGELASSADEPRGPMQMQIGEIRKARCKARPK